MKLLHPKTKQQIKQKHQRREPNPKLDIVKRRFNLYNRNRVPDEFICPITRDIMEDPVITSDGHTFERESIIGVFQTQGYISPITREELDQNLIVDCYIFYLVDLFLYQGIPQQKFQL